jgi:hypothetical protein
LRVGRPSARSSALVYREEVTAILLIVLADMNTNIAVIRELLEEELGREEDSEDDALGASPQVENRRYVDGSSSAALARERALGSGQQKRTGSDYARGRRGLQSPTMALGAGVAQLAEQRTCNA